MNNKNIGTHNQISKEIKDLASSGFLKFLELKQLQRKERILQEEIVRIEKALSSLQKGIIENDSKNTRMEKSSR